ncbi:MAG: alpha/beta hydrolase [Micrococcales bacterium]|nr:alpha/beta hydrolase [Micrococcales bacterium]
MSEVVLLDGWQHRRAPVHWQGWLAERLTEQGWRVDYLTLPDPESPRYDAWSRVVVRALRLAEQPIVVAHGLSVLLWLRMCEDPGLDIPPISRVLLVAPPAAGAHGGDVSEYRPGKGTAEALRRRHPAPLLVSADDDPYLPGGAASLVAQTGAEWVRFAEGAHLNTASGYGPWPDALAWCETGTWPRTPVATATPALSAHPDNEVIDMTSTTLDRWLAQTYAPSGHRQGILTVQADAAVIESVDRAVAAGGREPSRRHARLHPRIGEDRVRAADVEDFVRRYGHEYQAAVVDPRLFEGSEGATLARVFSDGGVALYDL